MEYAIKLLEEEIEALGTPREGTTAWWTLRAKSLGLSFLRTVKQRGIVDPLAADDLRKKLRNTLVQEEVKAVEPA